MGTHVQIRYTYTFLFCPEYSKHSFSSLLPRHAFFLFVHICEVKVVAENIFHRRTLGLMFWSLVVRTFGSFFGGTLFERGKKCKLGRKSD